MVVALIVAPENQWIASGFHVVIDAVARDRIGTVAETPEVMAATRERVLLHWLENIAPAGCG